MTTRRWWTVWGVWALLVAAVAVAGDGRRPSCVVDRVEGEWALVEYVVGDTVLFVDVPSSMVGSEGERASCQVVAEYDYRGGATFCEAHPEVPACDSSTFRRR